MVMDFNQLHDWDEKIALRAIEALANQSDVISTHALTTLVARPGATLKDREFMGKALRRLERKTLAEYVTLVPGVNSAGKAVMWRRWHAKKTVDTADQSATIAELERRLAEAEALTEHFRKIANAATMTKE